MKFAAQKRICIHNSVFAKSKIQAMHGLWRPTGNYRNPEINIAIILLEANWLNKKRTLAIKKVGSKSLFVLSNFILGGAEYHLCMENAICVPANMRFLTIQNPFC